MTGGANTTPLETATDADLLAAIRSGSVLIVGDSAGRGATYRARFRALTLEAKRRNLIGWEA